MKKLNWFISTILLSIALVSPLAGQQAAPIQPSATIQSAPPSPRTPRDPAAVKAQYQIVSSHLDAGGDIFLVANVDGLLEQGIEALVNLVAISAADNPDNTVVKDIAGRISPFLKKNGFYAIRGFGTSAVPRTDGLNTIKMFVSRDPAAAAMPFWKGLVGGKPRRMVSVDFLPRDTVLARIANTDLPTVWKMFRQGINEIAIPDAAASFERALANAEKTLAIHPDKLVDSTMDESFIAVLFSQERSVPLPIPSAGGGMPPTIPEPALLLGIAVKDDSLLRVVSNKLSIGGAPLAVSMVRSTPVFSSAVPLPLPVPLQPAFAQYSGFFLFGSNPRAVSDAVSSFQNRDGLAANGEFKSAFTGLPLAANNGLTYMSSRFAKVITDLQTSIAAPSSSPSQAALIKNLSASMGQGSSAFVIVNTDAGVMVNGAGPSSGREILACAGAAPVGLLAAIAIPSFVKARATSQKNACINNLRIIDSAKEQWAMAQKKTDGNAVDVAGACQYIKGAKLPVCPQGGTYTVGAIGDSPKCNIPGHEMMSY